MALKKGAVGLRRRLPRRDLRRGKADILTFGWQRHGKTGGGHEGARLVLALAVQGKEGARQPFTRHKAEKIALVFCRVRSSGQQRQRTFGGHGLRVRLFFGGWRKPRVMPGGQPFRAKVQGRVEQRAELDGAVAERAGVGGAPGGIGGGKGRKHRLAERRAQIDNMATGSSQMTASRRPPTRS